MRVCRLRLESWPCLSCQRRLNDTVAVAAHPVTWKKQLGADSVWIGIVKEILCRPRRRDRGDRYILHLQWLEYVSRCFRASLVIIITRLLLIETAGRQHVHRRHRGLSFERDVSSQRL